MPKPPSTDLFDLIHSLSSAEKRNFSVQVKNKSNKDLAYYRLFSLIEKMDEYDEAELIKSLKSNKEEDHLAFKKIHLHKIILESLNKFHRKSGPEEEVLNLLQNLKILYDRGLYWQSEKIVNKIQKLCLDYDLKEYQVVLLKWQRIMTLHMHNSESKKKVDSISEQERVSSLVNAELQTLHQLQSNIEVWEQVINVADTLRFGSDLTKNANKFRKDIEKKLTDSSLSFISRIRLFHSEFMLSYLIDKSIESEKYVDEWEQLWSNNPKMKVPYFRNYLVSLNIVLTHFVDTNKPKKCEPLFNILLEFTESRNKEVSFINKCKAYSFYYKNYIIQTVKSEAYQEAIDSFEKPQTKLYFEHFELFKKSQVLLALTVSNYFLGNYKAVAKAMVFSQADAHANQKALLSEIRVLYYLSQYHLDNISTLEHILASADLRTINQLEEYPFEKELIQHLIMYDKESGTNEKIVEEVHKRRNPNNRYYLNRLISAIDKL